MIWYKTTCKKAGFEKLWLKRTQICNAGMFSNLQWVTPTTKEDKLATCGMLSVVLSLLNTNKLQIWLEGSCQPLKPLMFGSMTDVQEESRAETARRETIRHRRALMRKGVGRRSFLSCSPGSDEQVFRCSGTSKSTGTVCRNQHKAN